MVYVFEIVPVGKIYHRWNIWDQRHPENLVRVTHSNGWLILKVWSYSPGEQHMSHLWKGESLTQKCRLGGDMLVPRRIGTEKWWLGIWWLPLFRFWRESVGNLLEGQKVVFVDFWTINSTDEFVVKFCLEMLASATPKRPPLGLQVHRVLASAEGTKTSENGVRQPTLPITYPPLRK